eukprot:996054-Amphidinium_carterae.1
MLLHTALNIVTSSINKVDRVRCSKAGGGSSTPRSAVPLATSASASAKTSREMCGAASACGPYVFRTCGPSYS